MGYYCGFTGLARFIFNVIKLCSWMLRISNLYRKIQSLSCCRYTTS